jgi:ankyrin repeat protein
MSQEFLDAATSGDVSKVKTMLHSDPSLARSKDANGVSVIMKATYYGGAEIDAKTDDGRTALDFANEYCWPDVMKLLEES